jgi:hypothetical protein
VKWLSQHSTPTLNEPARLTRRSGQVHDILANDEHGVNVVTQRAERNGKSWVSRAVHISHPDSDDRVKEFWAFQEDQAASDALWA